MPDPRIAELTKKIEYQALSLRRGGRKIPADRIVKPGQVHKLASALWTQAKKQPWPEGTLVLVVNAGGYGDMQTTEDDLDILMPDGSMELLRIKYIVKVED